MRMMTAAARNEELSRVLQFVNEGLEAFGCREEIKNQISLAVEEIFVNIAHYAYGGGEGSVLISAAIEGAPPQAVIRFADKGKPFDPTVRENPDLLLPLKERPIGGLGIFLARKCMDGMEYEYREGENRLTIRKGL